MVDDLKTYYSNLLDQHGRSPKATQHVSTVDQYKRFKILCQNVSPKSSVIDLGCGLGDMLVYLRDEGLKGSYLGADFVEGFIDKNNDFFSSEHDASFIHFDILSDVLPSNYDHVILSGVFNNIMEDNHYFMKTCLKKMFAAANKEISFNMMSTYVDYQADDLFYFDPLKIFDFCKKELSPLVMLKHDYALGEKNYPYEFSIFVQKEL